MSRLIVKNLPSYITPALLKEHFSQSKGPGGTITDVKVALKQDGTARRFGFVGYKTDKEALKAKEWYDKSFIDSTRVKVETIDAAKETPAPRPNKRPRLDTTSRDDAALTHSKTRASGRKPNLPAIESNEKHTSLEEFMEVMQPKAKVASWTDPLLPSQEMDKILHTTQTGSQDLPEDCLTDMEWMRQRMRSVGDAAGSEKVLEQSDGKGQDEGASEVNNPSVETILRTARLFVRNLTFTCTEEELRQLFEPFGAVSQIHTPIDSATKESKGLAFVTYVRPEDAVAAFIALDKKPFQGRLLHIIGAVDRNNTAVTTDREGKSKSVKEQRSEKRKATAGKDFNWAMLYMNSDAVLSSVADRLNISKSDILDPESPDAAVKLALAETHVIQETKSYFESHGVILSAFSGRRRAETIILVKNIPYGTTAEHLREMFGAHGELLRVLVPPAGTLAVIEFADADEARKAFRALAYRRLGNSVIYLEKGPLGMFQPTSTNFQAAIGVEPISIENADVEDDTDMDITSGKSLFVKNVAFATASERFAQVFRHLPGFAFARLQTKPDPKRPGARLSMGFGFVGFHTKEAAQKALKGMHGYVLDGHTLNVKFAGRGAEGQEEKKGGKEKAKTTKVLVKNIPFEATRKDIKELFGAHGQLKSVRVPKRFDRRARGFAFLEFVTRHEAENAYDALKHTHLLGRHLVLEWAEGEVNIDELRRKAGVGLGDGSDMPGKKRKLMLDEDGEGGEDDA
ncbi:hypothetical protein F5148DRAFT_1183792 [Russula earlei]|uniref:Uncharacterized protein n=1 Tax=Russula earlei TaxID=71964 RepID=A0ACC0UE50_9AGAM|nr:hypothetical protein F5148DRAFT_1183792 [Russula earlei]